MNRQTRIFVPPAKPFDQDTWAETLFGQVILPVVRGSQGLNWYWFSRYICPARQDAGDCNISKIPSDYVFPGTDNYRSVRFRYSIRDSECTDFENQCRSTLEKHNCRISDFLDYDAVADLGSDRHIGTDRAASRRSHRSDLVANLYWAMSQLALDALTGPDLDGRYRFEHNDSKEIPLGSSFEIPHHIFCNITDVPLRILVSQTAIGTDFSPPNNPIQSVKVRF